jgi:hypothetical protein
MRSALLRLCSAYRTVRRAAAATAEEGPEHAI